jgi:hypothetical protein
MFIPEFFEEKLKKMILPFIFEVSQFIKTHMESFYPQGLEEKNAKSPVGYSYSIFKKQGFFETVI